MSILESITVTAIWIPEHQRRTSHRQPQQTPTMDDQEGQRLPNTADVHLVDHGKQHRHSKGIHLRHHYHRLTCR